MLLVPNLNIEVTMNVAIYVRLLNEGLDVFRLVSAYSSCSKYFVLGNADFYDSIDEEWEFQAGSNISRSRADLSLKNS